MATGQGVTRYRGRDFPTLVEAQWAVFFDALEEPWYHDPKGQLVSNEEHYRPQFELPRLNSFLEVQHLDDHGMRTPMLDTAAEIEGPIVYLAVKELPTDQQLRDVGWWDPKHLQGVTNLTAGYEWSAWYPPNYPPVLAALEAAHAADFEPVVPLGRQPSVDRSEGQPSTQ